MATEKEEMYEEESKKSSKVIQYTTDIASMSLHLIVQSRIYHWQTKNKAFHDATAMLYDSFGTLIDTLVESVQGCYDTRIENIQAFEYENLKDADPSAELQENIEILKKAQPEFASQHQNIIDEMVACLDKILYLFTLE